MDPLVGLKENVIIGKHIPAGTGMRKYRDIRLDSELAMDDEIIFGDDEMEEELPGEINAEETSDESEMVIDFAEE